MLKKDPFGNIIYLKKWLIRIFGFLTHRRYKGFNSLQIEGSEIIRELPENGVLFISNHQTYFADVVAMFHVFNASLKGRRNNIKNIFYIWNPKLNIYFVAAKETMKAGLLPRILSLVGAITVERTWRDKGKDLEEKKQINPNDTENIKKALDDGWVITFPQGTTKSFSPIRKGTAHIIKQHKPIVVPIVIDGFRRSFDKKGIFMKKKGILQSFVIKELLKIDYEDDSVEDIIEKIEYAIEQHPSYLKVIPQELLDQDELLNKEREY
ncbi:lysophospholipid acyltransferase family protein [Capnocytophaga sp. ARDL2]|uniref:lysophospholipid acyltransferase family protein n=1 Tax=Capnocytophaga sp. ARDL2 TaxID=3238809 RepID=UPI003558B2FB